MRAEDVKNPKRMIRQALAEFESSVYDSDSVKFAYLQLDTIASGFRALHAEIFEEDEEDTPDEVFEKLAECGLDKNASRFASALEKIASQKWYDDNRESEQDAIDEAEQLREDLLELLTEFLDNKSAKGTTLPLFPESEGSS